MSEFVREPDAVADHFPVGDVSFVHITRMREPTGLVEAPSMTLRAGDVLRRTCTFVGGGACKQACQAPEGYTNFDKKCSDQNLLAAVERLDISPQDVLMVGVTENRAGFYDKLGEYDGQSTNSVGIRELPGFNAFFAHVDESVVLGARLADCGFVALEFSDREGRMVNGFVHMTRSNMQGGTARAFELDGKKVGGFEYFLTQALEHYGANAEDVQARVVAGIAGESYVRPISASKSPEQSYPGWGELGLLENISTPEWRHGSNAYKDGDLWKPNFRGMLRWQIAQVLDTGQVAYDGMIDPGDARTGHASNHAVKQGMPDGRDAYFVLPRSYEPSSKS